MPFFLIRGPELSTRCEFTVRLTSIPSKEEAVFCVSVRYRPVDADGEATMPTYLNWEGKLTIPSSWYNEPVLKLTDYVCKVYNERHPELNSVLQLNSSEYFLAKYYRRLGTKEQIKDVIERGGVSLCASTRSIVFSTRADTLDIVAGVPRTHRDPLLQLPRF